MASCTVYHFANANVNSCSLEPESITELRRQNERKLAQATAEDAANDNERGLIKDYKRQYDKVSGIAEKLNTARQEVLTAKRSDDGNTTAKKKIKNTGHTVRCLAGEEGFEPSAYGFGDRRSTS